MQNTIPDKSSIIASLQDTAHFQKSLKKVGLLLRQLFLKILSENTSMIYIFHQEPFTFHVE